MNRKGRSWSAWYGVILAIGLAGMACRQACAIGEVSALTLGVGENGAVSAVVDSSHTFAYFGTATGIASQVLLPNFTETGSLAISTNSLTSAIITSSFSYVYFGDNESQAEVNQVSIASFTVISTATFSTGQSSATAAVIGPDGAFGYFGTNTSPGVIVKVDLLTMTVVSTLTLQSGENYLSSAVIDSTGAFAYFGTNTNPGKVVKIQLSNFSEQSTLTLNNGQNFLTSAVIDSSNTFAYFGTNTSPGMVAKIQLSNFTEPVFRVLQQGGSLLTSAVIDSSGTYAYFGSNTSPGQVVRMLLSTFAENTTVTLGSGQDFLTSVVIDSPNQYAYFGTNTAPAIVVKLDLLDTRTGPPLITGQPSSVSVNPGQTATFFVGAAGTSPFTYQWQLNGVAIIGATTASYTTAPAALTDNGSKYSCVVTNSFGSTTSNPATLTVIPVIRVYPNPWRADRYMGQPITFDHLAPNSTIKIFTLSMHWVKTFATNTGSVAWDLTNDSGQNVASGYYFYDVTTGDSNQTTTGKIAIIR